MSGLDPEDAKLVTLAQASRARGPSTEGAAVRDDTGRTYTAVNVALSSLALSALQLAAAMAVSSGAGAIEAAALVTGAERPDEAGLATVAELGSGAVVFVAGQDGEVRDSVRV